MFMMLFMSVISGSEAFLSCHQFKFIHHFYHTSVAAFIFTRAVTTISTTSNILGLINYGLNSYAAKLRGKFEGI